MLVFMCWLSCCELFVFFFFKQKTAYEMRISDWSSDVCSSDLFEEMKGRIKEDDKSVPQKDGDFLYWREFETGAQYRKWFRRPVAGGDSQIILDEPALAEGKEYFRLGAISVSPDGRYLAFAVDDNGSERFEARVRDLQTGAILPDVIPGTLSSLVWTSDNKGFLYCLANENWRTDNVRLHWLGDPVEKDVELFHE